MAFEDPSNFFDLAVIDQNKYFLIPDTVSSISDDTLIRPAASSFYLSNLTSFSSIATDSVNSGFRWPAKTPSAALTPISLVFKYNTSESHPINSLILALNSIELPSAIPRSKNSSSNTESSSSSRLLTLLSASLSSSRSRLMDSRSLIIRGSIALSPLIHPTPGFRLARSFTESLTKWINSSAVRQRFTIFFSSSRAMNSFSLIIL
jgi:hypothetical protein